MQSAAADQLLAYYFASYFVVVELLVVLAMRVRLVFRFEVMAEVRRLIVDGGASRLVVEEQLLVYLEVYFACWGSLVRHRTLLVAFLLQI